MSGKRQPVKAMFTVFVAILMVAGLVTAMTPDAIAQETEAEGSVRFVHALSGGGPIDILVGDDRRVENLGFGSATEYAAFPDEDIEFTVVPTGASADEELLSDSIDVDSGNAYTVIIGNQEDDLDARVYEVDLDAIDDGQARVRVIHSSPDAGDLDVDLTPAGAPTTDDEDNSTRIAETDYLDEKDYENVAAGTYDVTIRVSGADDAVLEVDGVTFDPGFVYELVIIGRVSDGSLALLPLITSVSSPCSSVLEVGEIEDACVRFMHTSADAGPVDIYIDGARVVEELSYGSGTEFLPASDGDHDVEIVPAGLSNDESVLDNEFEFNEGQAYQVAILGLVADDDDGDNDLRLHTDEVDMTPLPAGQSRMRVIHAVPNAGAVDVLAGGDDALFEDVSFDEATGYQVVDAGVFTLDVQTTDGDESLISGAEIELAEGVAYDVYVVGRSGDGSVELVLLTSNATIREGGQGTPTALDPAAAETEQPNAEAVDATVVEGSGDEDAPIDDAPVTPVTSPTP